MTERQPDSTEDDDYAAYFTKPASAPLSDEEQQTYHLYYPTKEKTHDA